jgi:hypothetical protein
MDSRLNVYYWDGDAGRHFEQWLLLSLAAE